MIPKLSQPLEKAIRTSEGILVYVVNVGIVVVSAVEPGKLPPKWGAICVSVLTILHVISRTSLKVFALQNQAGISAPDPFEPVPVEAIGETADEISEFVGGRLPSKPETAVKPDGPSEETAKEEIKPGSSE